MRVCQPQRLPRTLARRREIARRARTRHRDFKEMVNVEHCVKGNVTKLTQRPDRDGGGGGQINSGKACGIVSVSPFSCASTLLSCTTQNRFLEKKTKRVRTSPTFEIGLNKLLGHRFHPGLKKKKIKGLSDALAKPSWTSSPSARTRTIMEGQYVKKGS